MRTCTPENIVRNDKKLVDLFGRQINYLRISLTGRCNFRCTYCYSTGNEREKSKRELSTKNLIRLINSFVLLGIRKIRLTGGEPLLRQGLVDLIENVSSIEGLEAVGITTNGFLLEKYFPLLAKAGLNRLNVSLDTMRRNIFKKITGVDRFEQVYSSLLKVITADVFEKVKVNMVVMRGINDDEIPAFARWALEKNVELRFIEYMPSKLTGWASGLFISEEEIKRKIDLDLVPIGSNSDYDGPSEIYGCQDYPGRIGFISTVSRSFCGRCNRLRLTSHGELFGCLFGDSRLDLTGALRNCLSTDEIGEIIETAVKSPGFRRRQGSESIGLYSPPMRLIGG